MPDAASAPHRTTFTVIAVVLVILGIFSSLDVPNLTYTGFFTDGNNNVIAVQPGSPAAAAGMQTGDVMKSINGVSVEDTKGLLQQHRPAAGDAWPYDVQRGDQTVSLQLTHAALPTKDRIVARLATLLGLCFLGFGLWAYFAAPSHATTVFTAFALSFGLAFLGVPYFESPAIRNVVGAIVLSVILIGIAALVHFLLLFPGSRTAPERPGALKRVYLPAIVVCLIFLGFTLLQPTSTSGINVFLRTMFGVFIAGYFVVALALLFRRYSAATAEARRAHGLGLMLGGALLGLGPLTISSALGVVLPRVVLPQAQYYFLTLGLIPITFALAAVRSARSGMA